MAIDVEKYQRLKKRADKAKTDADRAAGALDRTMDELKTEFDCETIEDAEARLKELEADEAEAETAYDKALAEFETAWADRFDD